MLIKISKISACLIVKNEENNLDDCLNSISEVADEIIIVDTGSTDNTVQIANKYNTKIYHYKWHDDFASARNFALSKATFPFILSIDADERLLNPKELLAVIKNAKDEVGGWLINLTSFAERSDKTKDTYVTNLLRLFRNHPKIKFKGIIHEQIIESITKNNYKLENTNIKIEHIGYNLSKQEMLKKQERNLNLLLKAIETHPNDTYYLYQIAKTYMALNQKEQANKYFNICLENCTENSSIKPQALNYSAILSYQMGNKDQAFQKAEQSLKIIKNQSFANYVQAEVYSDNLDYENAIDAYKKMLIALENPDTITQVIGDYSISPELIYFKLGKSYIGLKQYEKAQIQFEKGLKINPYETSCLIGMGNVYFVKKDYIIALNYLNQAKKIAPERKEIDEFINQINDQKNNQKSNDNNPNTNNETMPNSSDNPIIKNSNQLNSVDQLKQILRNNAKPNQQENEPHKIENEKPFISLSMIVKNEEKDLPGCLNSVQNLVDEIIIVDTGSEDKTVEIAKKYNAKIYHFDWIDNFAAARNESLKHCNGEWILYLDADERIKNIDFQKLRYMLKNVESNLGMLVCTIESTHKALDGSSEVHRGGYPRIFKNLGYPKIQFTGRVHEQISPSLKKHGYGMSMSDIVIEHLGYDQPREVMEAKVNRNYKLLLQHVKEEPVNGYAWFQLGQTLAQMQITEEAENAIKFAIDCGNLSDSIHASAASTLSQMTGNRKDYQQSLKWAEISLEKAPEQVYGLVLKAYSLLHLNKFKEAENTFQKSLLKLQNKSKVPQSGFDIMLSEDVIKKGLEKAQKHINSD